MIVTDLGVGPSDAQKEIYDTRGCHTRFLFLEMLYRDHLFVEVNVDGDDARVVYH